ncbi:uncharacterized protein LOC144360107 [Saccoglossus kowalevskii]
MVTNLSDTISYFGLGLTVREHRKQGIHKDLLRARFQYAGDRNYALSSADQHRCDVFVDVGFRQIDNNFLVKCFMGSVDHSIVSITSSKSIDIVPYDKVTFNSLVQYDSLVSPFPRPDNLKIWCSRAKSVLVARKLNSNEVVGYGVIHTLLPGEFTILPLYANDEDIAHMLFNELVMSLPNYSKTRMHILVNNKTGVEIAKKYKLDEELYTLHRQYTKHVIPLPIDNVISAGSPEMSLI